MLYCNIAKAKRFQTVASCIPDHYLSFPLYSSAEKPQITDKKDNIVDHLVRGRLLGRKWMYWWGQDGGGERRRRRNVERSGHKQLDFPGWGEVAGS